MVNVKTEALNQEQILDAICEFLVTDDGKLRAAHCLTDVTYQQMYIKRSQRTEQSSIQDEMGAGTSASAASHQRERQNAMAPNSNISTHPQAMPLQQIPQINIECGSQTTSVSVAPLSDMASQKHFIKRVQPENEKISHQRRLKLNELKSVP